MAHLTLAGVSDDGKCLLLVDDTGAESTLDIDARLRAALRGDTARLGQLENKMDSALRPRDIQARIRAGETPEAVASAAATTVEKIMAFAAPVLAERQHVAERAQRSSVRRRTPEGGAGGGARVLGDAVASHLRAQQVDPDVVEWDAWRREDGRWTLTGEFASARRSGHAQFTFDVPGNYVVADNDDARWLLGEVLPEPEPQRDDLRAARQRRLSPVTDDDTLPLGDDAIELVSEDQPLEAFLTEEPPAAPQRADERARREEAADVAARDGEHEPAEPSSEPAQEPVAEEPAEEPVAEPVAEQPEEEPPTRRPVRKSRGRASVPSWDEIMFGGGRSE